MKMKGVNVKKGGQGFQGGSMLSRGVNAIKGGQCCIPLLDQACESTIGWRIWFCLFRLVRIFSVVSFALVFCFLLFSCFLLIR